MAEIGRNHPLVSRYLDGKCFAHVLHQFANDQGERPPLYEREDGRIAFTVAMDVFGVPANLSFSTIDDLLWCDADFDLGQTDCAAPYSHLLMSLDEIYGHKWIHDAKGDFFTTDTWKLGRGSITLQREWTSDPDVMERVTIHRSYSGKPAKT